MSNVFINKDETIVISIWVGEDGNKKTRYWSRESDKPKKNLSSNRYEIVFRKPNFRDSTLLLDLGVKMNAQGGMDLAFNEIRYRRLEILIKSWNLKDLKGKEVPVGIEAIGDLHPTFAMVLAAALERELGIEDGSLEEDFQEEETETAQEEREENNSPENLIEG